MQDKEIEVKIKVEDKKEIQKRLKKLGWTIKDLVFQKTFQNDTPDYSLRSKGIFPRTRLESCEGKGRVSSFAIKINPRGKFEGETPNDDYFRRTEYSIEIEDAAEMSRMLEILGFEDVRIWEKYRQIWENKNNKEVEITIDSLPFGDFLEIEGEEKSIEEMMKNLKIEKKERIPLPYWLVYKKWCRENKKTLKKEVTFDNFNKR